MNINDIRSSCSGDSTFSWSLSATPQVSAISPASGSLSAATVLTITGSGFDSVNEKNMVVIGGEPCNVTSSTSVEIQCNIGRGPVGPHEVEVVVLGKGKAAHDGGPHEFSYDLTASSISPSTGSLAGKSVSSTVDGMNYLELEFTYFKYIFKVLLGHQRGSCSCAYKQTMG